MLNKLDLLFINYKFLMISLAVSGTVGIVVFVQGHSCTAVQLSSSNDNVLTPCFFEEGKGCVCCHIFDVMMLHFQNRPVREEFTIGSLCESHSLDLGKPLQLETSRLQDICMSLPFPGVLHDTC